MRGFFFRKVNWSDVWVILTWNCLIACVITCFFICCRADYYGKCWLGVTWDCYHQVKYDNDAGFFFFCSTMLFSYVCAIFSCERWKMKILHKCGKAIFIKIKIRKTFFGGMLGIFCSFTKFKRFKKSSKKINLNFCKSLREKWKTKKKSQKCLKKYFTLIGFAL